MAIRLVVGLGNPGKKYEGTRHNIGREIVESLCESPLSNVKWLVTESYMNESGIEVARAVKYGNLSPREVLIVLDEFQIPLRKVSLLTKGSDGGHNGLKSVIDCLGTSDVPRLRIGIGPLPENGNPADFVLSRFSAVEAKMVQELKPDYEDAVMVSITEGIDASMNKYNNRWLR